MPNFSPVQFSSPGVVTREFDFSAVAKGQGAAIFGLLNVFERGPIGTPTLVRSLPEAQRLFGNFLSSYYGMHVVKQFFDNGGQQVYIVRTAHYTDPADASTITAMKATLTLKDRAVAPLDTLRVDALSEGTWANGATGGVGVEVVAATIDAATGFRINVYSNGVKVENWDNLNLDPTSPDYAETRINSNSQFITVTNLASATAAPDNRPALVAVTSLAGGNDGLTGLVDADFVGNAAAVTGLHAFDSIVSLDFIATTGRTGFTVADALRAYCEGRADVFGICETPSSLSVTDAIAFRNQTTPYAGVAFDSTYMALYYPWLKFTDAVTGLPRYFPPSAAIAGMYTANDLAGGPWNAPAGFQRGVLRQVLGLETDIQQAQNDLLFPQGINAVVRKDGVGFVVMGDLTLQRKPTALQSIGTRRAMLTIERTLKTFAEASVLFQPLDDQTRAAVKRYFDAYLKGVQQARGISEYHIVCDDTNNTDTDISQNRLNIDVYIKPTKYAKFITINLALTDTTVSFSELFATS